LRETIAAAGWGVLFLISAKAGVSKKAGLAINQKSIS